MALILCIEDDEDMLDVLSYELQAFGHNVIESRSGDEALGLIKAHKPDLIVSDVRMPKMDGLELLIKIRSGVEEAKNIPVILVSALTHQHCHDEALKYGASAFILKPINWDNLRHAVDQAIQ